MLHYGIIGCGMMGQEHLRNIALLENASVAAIYEPDPGMRAAAAALMPRARMVGSVAEVLAVPEVNCLLIASPNHLHLGQLEEIARIRPLPVLCEKPLFTDPADSPRLQWIFILRMGVMSLGPLLVWKVNGSSLCRYRSLRK